MPVMTTKNIEAKAEEEPMDFTPIEAEVPEAKAEPNPKAVPEKVPQREINATKAALDAQPQREIYLSDEPGRYGKGPHIVQVNDYKYAVPTGRVVQVPETIHQILTEQIRADRMDHEYRQEAE